MVLTTLTHIMLVSPCLRVGVLCCDMSGACYSLPGVIRGQYKRRGVIATLTLCCSHVGQAVQSGAVEPSDLQERRGVRGAGPPG